MRPPKNNPPPLYLASPRKPTVRTPRKAIQARAKRGRQRRHSQSPEVIDIDIDLDSDDDRDHDDCDRDDSAQDPPAPASQPAPKKPRSAPKKSQSASNNTPAYDVLHFFGPRLNPQDAKGELRPCLACNKKYVLSNSSENSMLTSSLFLVVKGSTTHGIHTPPRTVICETTLRPNTRRSTSACARRKGGRCSCRN